MGPHDTKNAGNSFELPGPSVITFNDGLVFYEFVAYPYPYPDVCVTNAVFGQGTQIQTATSTRPQDILSPYQASMCPRRAGFEAAEPPCRYASTSP